MEINVLISTRELESIFSDTMIDRLTTSLSDFNKTQLNVLINKHVRSYCLFIGMEVCQYMSSDDKKVSLENQMWKIESDFKNDMEIFLSRFLFWLKDSIDEFLEWFKNIMTNVFMKNLYNVIGEDVYDSRKFKLRDFEHNSDASSSGDRILSINFEKRQVPFNGLSMAV